MQSMDTSTMYKMVNDNSGNVPEAAKQAAASMLAHPGEWRRVETMDQAQVDGVSGLDNLDQVANGNFTPKREGNFVSNDPNTGLIQART
jgi:hypothetical protein